MGEENANNLFVELKRRKVLRAAGVYGVTAFGLTEILTFVLENFGAPFWSSKLIAALFVAGFPIAMFLSWAFDVGPGGHLTRTRFTGRSTSQILGLAIVILFLSTGGLFYLIFPHGKIDAEDGRASAALVPIKEALGNVMAILPFRNLSPEPSDSYLSAGMADTLLSKLQVVRGMTVIASSSSSTFANRSDPVRELARELGVGKVVRGSVQKIGNQVRIVAELVRSTSGVQIWSAKYDGQPEDIFSIQDRIASDLVRALEVAQEDRLGLTDGYKPALDAYEALTKGRLAMAKGTVDGLKTAVSQFQRAIEIDPGYAAAQVNLAEAYALQDTYTYGSSDSYSGIPSARVRMLQRPLIDKALELDPASATALALLAAMTANIDDADTHFREAIALAPNSATVLLDYARFLLLRVGRFDKAEEIVSKAAELDPLSPIIRYNHAKAVWSVGRAEKAVGMMIENVKRNPDFPFNYKLMARWQMQLGHVDSALRWIRTARRIDPDSPSHWGEFGGECYVLASLGDLQAATSCSAEFSAAHPDSITARRERAMATGDFATLVEIFEAAVAAEPGNIYRVNQLIFAYQGNADFEKALSFFKSSYLDIYAGQQASNALTTWPTLTVASGACVLQRHELCERLLKMAQQGITEHRLILGGGFLVGTEQMQIHAIRGDKQATIAEFRRIVDAGWRFLWSYIQYQPEFAAYLDDPEFASILAEVAADIAVQRERYYANPDKPLF